MTYEESLDFLYRQLPMYQRTGKAALKPNLDNTYRLLEALENPHLQLKFVHVAGTNGKGSSAHSIASILQAAGFKTGLYTSPHLKSFTERIKINGVEVPSSFIAEFVSRIKADIEVIRPSFFEVTVAMAFEYFYQRQVDIAVIEVGLGGRLDSTNVITPEVSLITSIGFDHMDLLGDTLEKIAYEKAGIIKRNIPVVIGDLQDETWPVFEAVAENLSAPIIRATAMVQLLDDMGSTRTISYQNQSYQIDLLSDYYLSNLPGIFETVDTLRQIGWQITEDAIKKGLSNVVHSTGLKGRFQKLGEHPLMIADISHNEPGLQALFKQVGNLEFEVLHLIYGTVKDKDLKRILPILKSKSTRYYFTQSGVPRSLPVEELCEEVRKIDMVGSGYANVNMALTEARKNASSKDLILITGSTFVVAEIDEL